MTTYISPTKLLTIGVVLALLILSIGGAVADRIQERAAADRLQFGAVSFDTAATVSDVARG